MPKVTLNKPVTVDKKKDKPCSQQRVVSTPSATNAEDFYRELLEQIADWPRNDRGRRLAQSGLTFWDAMQDEKRRRANDGSCD